MGRKFFIGSLGSYSKIALALGIAKDTPPIEIIKIQREKTANPVKPVVVSSGPVKQNIVKGEDVNLFEFPVLKSHENDGGRYISTFNGVVTKDPDTGWTVNYWSTDPLVIYRVFKNRLKQAIYNLSKLAELLEREEIYVCEECGYKTLSDEAEKHNYRCPVCGGDLRKQDELPDFRELVKELKKAYTEFEL